MRDSRLVLVSAVAPVLWGTGYLATTQLLPAHRPLLAGALRALPAGLLLLAVVAGLARRRLLPRGVWWWRSAVLALLNIGLFFALLCTAAYRLPGGIAAVLGAVGPFLVAGFAYPLLRERPARRTLVAGAIGVAGVSLLVLRATVGLDPLGLAAAAGAVVTMSLGTVLGRRWGVPDGYGQRRTAVLALAGWQLTMGGVALLPLARLVEGPLPTLTPTNLLGFAYMSIVGTALAHFLWFQAVASLAPARITVLNLLSPLTAAALGWLVLGQALSPGQLLGAAAVLAAVLLGATTRRTPTKPAPAPAPGQRAPAPATTQPAPTPATAQSSPGPRVPTHGIPAKPTRPSREPTRPTLEPTPASRQPTRPTLEPTPASREPTRATLEPTPASRQPTRATLEPTPASRQSTRATLEPTRA